MNEKVVFTQLIDQEGRTQDTNLYVRFTENDTVNLTLIGRSVDIESEESNYVQSLLTLMTKLPEGFQLKFSHSFQIENMDGLEVINVEEFVSVTFDYDPDEPQLRYNLLCDYGRETFTSESTEDFSIALQALQTKMDINFSICAFCSNADFRSTGGEDLRHGWYCLRDVENRKPELPWFQREEEFQKAYPNVSAFHWCPRYAKAVNRLL
ncbi:hypothetical protein J31TS6_00770 [Brevibacillus reuszeri]|uniref:hypothetical protein n=1 Tax=Brevibacillus reuszeri TaxID=54915 RepID=UPI001B2DEE19|nr:hypothetical protein [Brevibacillus reuszeri]GIO04049.1 hypothetical protein J31TS6_00770 [Brevibacillus reuszeri]